MMWFRPITRRDLMALLSSRRGGEGVSAIEAPLGIPQQVAPDETIALWPDNPESVGVLPAAVIVPAGGAHDFLAWTASYLRDYRPFTAFCRVIERPIAEMLFMVHPVPALRQYEGICSGLVLGESLAQSRGRLELRDLPTAIYAATLSYSLSRGVAVTRTLVLSELISNLWSRARDLTVQPRTVVPPAAIASIWSVVFQFSFEKRLQPTLFDPDDGIREAWSELAAGGEVSEKVWAKTTHGVPELKPIREMTKLPRERRLELVDVGLAVIGAAGRDGNERWPFIAGYITSMLSPGTLDHAEVLTPFAGVIPTAFLWYGLFAGLFSRGEGLPAGSQVARRIVRDLTAPDRLFERPRCDIAFEELAMLGAGDAAVSQRITRPSRLDIDLIPGVTMTVRGATQEAYGEENLRRTQEADTRRILAEMEEAAIRQRFLADRLRDHLGLNEQSRPVVPSKKKRPDKS